MDASSALSAPVVSTTRTVAAGAQWSGTSAEAFRWTRPSCPKRCTSCTLTDTQSCADLVPDTHAFDEIWNQATNGTSPAAPRGSQHLAALAFTEYWAARRTAEYRRALDPHDPTLRNLDVEAGLGRWLVASPCWHKRESRSIRRHPICGHRLSRAGVAQPHADGDNVLECTL
jgi:hypothetical protein